MSNPKVGCGQQFKLPDGGYVNCYRDFRHEGDHDFKIAERLIENAALREQVAQFNEAVNIAQAKQMEMEGQVAIMFKVWEQLKNAAELALDLCRCGIDTNGIPCIKCQALHDAIYENTKTMERA